MYVDTRSYRPGYNPQFLRDRGISMNAGESKASGCVAASAPTVKMPEPEPEQIEPSPHHVVTINGMAISLPKISIQAGDLE